MINITIRQAATATIKKVLETVEQIGSIELQKCLNDNSKNLQTLRLHTFKELHSRQKQTAPQKQTRQLITDVVMVKRLLQLKAVGKDANLEETIGEYLCSKIPQALFVSNGSMRHGCVAGWLTAVLNVTHLKMEEKLQESG